jgi:serine/threonine protein phosphatase 1
VADTVQQFNINLDGRDFVVGDIHGRFDRLRDQLAEHSFDDTRDRLFSVGDLIDRGPHSAEALHWLRKPWFHTCLGNHEEMLLNSPRRTSNMLSWILMNGGEWWLELDQHVRREYIETLNAVPLALEVETARGRVGIVHADVPSWLSWPQFTEALSGGNDEVRQWALWGRERATGHVEQGVRGIDRVVCGHTVMVTGWPKTVENVWFIDTGAFLDSPRARLTMLPLDELFIEAVTVTCPDD